MEAKGPVDPHISLPWPRKLRRARRFAQAYLFLRRLHPTLKRGGFTEARRRTLLPWKPNSRELSQDDPLVQDIEWAVEEACRWQLQKSECLHRALTGYYLLRRVGAQPRFVMAIQNKPFASHAWVQLGDTPIADRAMSARRYLFRPVLYLPDSSASQRAATALAPASGT